MSADQDHLDAGTGVGDLRAGRGLDERSAAPGGQRHRSRLAAGRLGGRDMAALMPSAISSTGRVKPPHEMTVATRGRLVVSSR